MKISGNTVLITGGATGIGLAYAEEFLKAGSKVIICGRREIRLAEVKAKYPDIITRTCDIGKVAERKALYEWAEMNYPDINILINNAGIQRMSGFLNNTAPLFAEENEIETNLVAPVQLSALFIPILQKQKESAIVNISSGLGFVPLAIMPVYCATKAALHSFSVSLRHQLKKTSIKVFEIIPPMVDTELGSGGREERKVVYRGISTKEFIGPAFKAIQDDEYECAIGQSKGLVSASHSAFDEAFNRMNH